MPSTRRKRTAKVKVTLTRHTIEALIPQARPWIAWDNRVIGFGLKIHPTGTKSFIVDYRTRDRGRAARQRRVVIGRADQMPPDHARRRAREMLDDVARGRIRPRRGCPPTAARRLRRPSRST